MSKSRKSHRVCFANLTRLELTPPSEQRRQKSYKQKALPPAGSEQSLSVFRLIESFLADSLFLAPSHGTKRSRTAKMNTSLDYKLSRMERNTWALLASIDRRMEAMRQEHIKLFQILGSSPLSSAGSTTPSSPTDTEQTCPAAPGSVNSDTESDAEHNRNMALLAGMERITKKMERGNAEMLRYCKSFTPLCAVGY